MATVITLLVICAAVIAAIVHIVKSKKNGKCAGCPYSKGDENCHCK